MPTVFAAPAAPPARTAHPGPRPAQVGEVRLLAKAYVVAGLVAGATALVPFSDSSPRTLAAAVALVGVALGTWLWWWAPRAATSLVHALVAFATGVISLTVASSTTPAGLQVTLISYVWVALYTATVHRRGTMVLHLALIGIGLAAALWAAEAVSQPQTWFFVMATVAGVAVAMNAKVGRLREDAALDPLTGVLSRRALLDQAAREMARARRTGELTTLVLLDLDDFKRVNDTAGHAAGDEVLRDLTASWRAALRRGDALGRIGGDEFAIVLPRSGPAEADVVAQRLRAASQACGWSWGAAVWTGETLEEWFARADAELYLGKAVRTSV